MSSRLTDPVRVAVTQWTVGIRPSWSVGEVRNALRQHALGDFSLSAQLVDSMGEDDCLPGLLDKLVDAVLGSEFELCPVDAPNRQQSKALVKRYDPLWWDWFPESELGELLRWYRTLGVAVGVLDWERGDSQWNARLRTLHPQFLRFDSFRNRFLYQAQEGELEVTPGDGTWILLADGLRGWMRGAVRALAVTWIAKQLTLRDWNRYNERHGLPIIKAFAPAIADEPDREQFWEDLQDLNSEMVAQLPSHLDEKGARFDLELLEAKDQSFNTFEKHVDRCDRRFMVYILGSNLSTEVTGQGSRAAADTHRGVEESKATALATKLSTETRLQGLYPILAANVSGLTFEVTPWPKWDTQPANDTKAEAEDQKEFGLAVKAVQDAGYDVDNIDELSERHGLKLVKREVPAPVVAPAAVPGNAPPAPANPDQNTPAVAARADDERTRAAAEPDNRDNGQEYADRVADEMTAHGARELAPTVAGMIAAVRKAGSYEEARLLIASRYASLTEPSELASLTDAALTMAQLGGHLGLKEDTLEPETGT